MISALPKGQTPWRIDWLGDIAFPDRSARRKQPSIFVHLSRVADPRALVDPALLLSPEATEHAKYQIGRWLSVGTLPLLRVGDIWRGSRLLIQPDYEIETFSALRIDGSTTTLIKAGLNKDDRGFLLPLSEHPWHRECTQSYCIEISLGDGRRLIVPCAELIRFYFGSSSGLISKLFLPPLSKDALYSEARFDHARGHLALKIAEKIAGTSAADIGRLSLDSHAWRSAVCVGTSLLKGAATGQQIFPHTFFPFEGMTDLVAVGKWVSYGGMARSTFVVFSLRTCSHPFPFRSLSYEGPGVEQPPKHGGQPRFVAPHTGAANGRNQTLVERDASNRLAAKTLWMHFERRFPDLAHKPVWKRRVLVDINATSGSLRSTTSNVAEAAVGEPGSEQRIRPVSLEMTLAKDHQPPDFLRAIVEELRKVQEADVTLLTAGEHDGWTIPIPVRGDETNDLRCTYFVEGSNGERRSRLLSAFHVSSCCGVNFCLVLVESDPVYAHFHPVPDAFDGFWPLIEIAVKNFLDDALDRKMGGTGMSFRRGLRMALQDSKPDSRGTCHCTGAGANLGGRRQGVMSSCSPFCFLPVPFLSAASTSSPSATVRARLL